MLFYLATKPLKVDTGNPIRLSFFLQIFKHSLKMFNLPRLLLTEMFLKFSPKYKNAFWIVTAPGMSDPNKWHDRWNSNSRTVKITFFHTSLIILPSLGKLFCLI
jgi:hypothetical protein